MRCNTAQGHYLSRALPAAEAEGWVRNAAIEPALMGAGDPRDARVQARRVGRASSA
jgi:hypothetical protein